MCDTLVALPAATARGALLFAKNSDRERNEAQGLELHDAARHAAGASVKLTYITIPQARETHACLLSRPFWMWGAEMGANAHGVVIGNEAMHAVIAPDRAAALTGMDLVRLGLERGASAAEAVEVMIALLEAHGQGGNCGHLHDFRYHNGFIVADAREAYVLETVNRYWAVERVADVRALSNALSIGDAPLRMSEALRTHAAAQGWSARFDFAERLIDAEKDAGTFGRGRCARGTALLRRDEGSLTPASMKRVLRDHGEEGEALGWTPRDTRFRSICMHAADGARRSQTVGSMMSELGARRAVHWFTGSSAPCLSVFKPFAFGAALPPQGAPPSDVCDPRARWWRHERLHRAALGDYVRVARAIAAERDALEVSFAARVDAADDVALSDVIAACWAEADAAEARWSALATHGGAVDDGYAQSWSRLSAAARMT